MSNNLVDLRLQRGEENWHNKYNSLIDKLIKDLSNVSIIKLDQTTKIAIDKNGNLINAITKEVLVPKYLDIDNIDEKIREYINKNINNILADSYVDTSQIGIHSTDKLISIFEPTGITIYSKEPKNKQNLWMQDADKLAPIPSKIVIGQEAPKNKNFLWLKG